MVPPASPNWRCSSAMKLQQGEGGPHIDSQSVSVRQNGTHEALQTSGPPQLMSDVAQPAANSHMGGLPRVV